MPPPNRIGAATTAARSTYGIRSGTRPVTTTRPVAASRSRAGGGAPAHRVPPRRTPELDRGARRRVRLPEHGDHVRSADLPDVDPHRRVLDLDDIRTPLAQHLGQPLAKDSHVELGRPQRRPGEQEQPGAHAPKRTRARRPRRIRPLDLYEEIEARPQAR